MKKSVLLSALVVAVLLGAAAYATAESITYTAASGIKTTNGTVNVVASVSPKLSLTLSTPASGQTVDFGPVDPGGATLPQTVDVTVRSNKNYDLTKAITGAAPIGLLTTLADSTGNAVTSGQLFSDAYIVNIPWATAPGVYTATVQYTVTQP